MANVARHTGAPVGAEALEEPVGRIDRPGRREVLGGPCRVEKRAEMPLPLLSLLWSSLFPPKAEVVVPGSVPGAPLQATPATEKSDKNGRYATLMDAFAFVWLRSRASSRRHSVRPAGASLRQRNEQGRCQPFSDSRRSLAMARCVSFRDSTRPHTRKGCEPCAETSGEFRDLARERGVVSVDGSSTVDSRLQAAVSSRGAAQSE